MTGTDWRERAACMDYDPEWWFPDKSETAQRDMAKAICGECPVRRDCQIFVDEIKPGYGVWAGRERIRKESRYQSPAEQNPCGSPGPSGQRRHSRRGEPTCTACNAAATRYHAEQRAQRQGMNG